MSYEAFVLTEECRQLLAVLYPPKYPDWIGHHVTHRFGIERPADPAATLAYGIVRFDVEIIGYVEEDGLEAFVCTVDKGSQRPDGKTYHLTWSLDRKKGKKPVDSNQLIARKGNQLINPFIIVTTFEYIR